MANLFERGQYSLADALSIAHEILFDNLPAATCVVDPAAVSATPIKACFQELLNSTSPGWKATGAAIRRCRIISKMAHKGAPFFNFLPFT